MNETQLSLELASSGVGLGPTEVRRFLTYIGQIRRWNRRLNLVADAQVDEIVRRHLLDSLLGLRFVPHASPGTERVRAVDVGSGGGFPGLVAAAVRPGWEVTLVDSSAKKAAFLLGAADEMELSNVRVVRARAEEMGRGMFEKESSFDLCLSRAVAPVTKLAPLCGPLLRPGGICGWWKGSGAAAEMEQGAGSLKKQGLRPMGRCLYRLPGEDISRAIVLLMRLG